MTSAVTAKSAERNWLLFLVGAGHFYSHFVMLALPPLFLLMKQELGVSYVALGAIVSAMATTTAVGQIPMGFLVDRIGGRLILLCGIGLMSGCLVLVAYLPSYWALFAIFGLAGVGNSVFHPADYAIMTAKLDDAIYGRAFSLHSFTGYLGWSFAALIMLPLANGVGWRIAVLLVGVAGLFVTVAMMCGSRFLDDRGGPKLQAGGKSPTTRGLKDGLSLMTSLSMVMLFLFFGLSATVTSGIMAFSIPANLALHSLNDVGASLALTAHLAASAAGVLIGGWLADKTRRHNVVTSIAVLAMSGSVLMLAFEGALVALTFAAMIFAGLFYGISSPSRDILIKNATPAGSSGVAFGFTSSGMSVGNLIGPLLCGWFMDNGHPQLMFVALAAIMVISVATVVSTRVRFEAV